MALNAAANIRVKRGEPRRVLEQLRLLRQRRDESAVEPIVWLRMSFTEAYAALACEEWTSAADGYGQCIADATAEGDDRRKAQALSNLSVVDMATGDLAAASAHLEQALELIAPMRDPTTTSYIKVNLGLVALLAGDTTTAQTRYREALLISGANGESTLTHGALLGIALSVGSHNAGTVTAITLHGVIDRFLKAQPSGLDAVELKLWAEDCAARRQQEGEARFDRVLEQGRHVSVADAVDLALSSKPTGTPGARLD